MTEYSWAKDRLAQGRIRSPTHATRAYLAVTDERRIPFSAFVVVVVVVVFISSNCTMA